MLTRSVVIKRMCCVTSSLRISARYHKALERVMAITDFQTGVSFDFLSFQDYVLKMEL